MSILKFQAWNKNVGEFIDPKMIRISGVGLIEVDDGKEWILPADPKQIEILLYTGIKDKEGKRIYEGDIVKFDSTLMEVMWDKEKCRFIFYQAEWNEIHDINSGAKIVGNIYENSELLKTKNK